MKKIYLFILVFTLLIPNIVLANSISDIEMDIYIDNDGNAHVTEKWTAKLNKGTEGYKPYYNLGESKISNFKVSMNNKNFTLLDNWNINESFEYKKYKNGINYVSDGIELCFGISEYGKNTYILNYDISNFVVNTSDEHQMIYWTLFPQNYEPSPKKVYIKIHSDFNYSNNVYIWGYGKEGVPTHLNNGYIEMDSQKKVKKDEYMTILVKFPMNTYNLTTTLENSFDYYLTMANYGTKSKKNNYIKENNFSLENILILIIEGLPILSAIIYLIKKPVKRKKSKFIEKKPDYNDVPYYRKTPYSIDNLIRIYWIAKEYKLTKNYNNLFGAFLLKWIYYGNIYIKNNEKNEKIIILNNNNNLTKYEMQLYEMLKEASNNNMINRKDLIDWCKRNCSKFINFFENAMMEEQNRLGQENYIFNESYESYVIGPNLNEEAKKMMGLKKFLEDFSKISDKEPIEVKLWNEYLIYAQIFNIAKKVTSNLSQFYPNICNEYTCECLDFVDDISLKSYDNANNELEKIYFEEETKNSSFDGGGGFSSGGGGGGSFGGGGGGGGFR